MIVPYSGLARTTAISGQVEASCWSWSTLCAMDPAPMAVHELKGAGEIVVATQGRFLSAVADGLLDPSEVRHWFWDEAVTLVDVAGWFSDAGPEDVETLLRGSFNRSRTHKFDKKEHQTIRSVAELAGTSGYDFFSWDKHGSFVLAMEALLPLMRRTLPSSRRFGGQSNFASGLTNSFSASGAACSSLRSHALFLGSAWL